MFLYYKRTIKYSIIIPQMGTITSIKDEGKVPLAESRIPPSEREREREELHTIQRHEL